MSACCTCAFFLPQKLFWPSHRLPIGPFGTKPFFFTPQLKNSVCGGVSTRPPVVNFFFRKDEGHPPPPP